VVIGGSGTPGTRYELLKRELVHIMQQAGTPTLTSITREHVIAST
jgi:hypothetical protein